MICNKKDINISVSSKEALKNVMIFHFNITFKFSIMTRRVAIIVISMQTKERVAVIHNNSIA